MKIWAEGSVLQELCAGVKLGTDLGEIVALVAKISP